MIRLGFTNDDDADVLLVRTLLKIEGRSDSAYLEKVTDINS